MSQGRDALPIRSPGGWALPGALELARTLRPLMRRVPSHVDFVVDEEATAYRIAEEGLWVPALRPAPARWLTLSLVVDAGASMHVWHHTVQELRMLMEYQGAFHNIWVWTLDTSCQDKLTLYLGTSSVARRPSAILDPTGSHLICVVTDCISPAWYSGEVTKILTAWGQVQPVVLMQMLPQRLWSLTALAMANIIYVGASSPGIPNVSLKKEMLPRQRSRKPPAGVPIPIVTLESDMLSVWTHLITATGNAQAPALILSTALMPKDDEPHSNEPEISAVQRLRAFHATASSMAVRLACLLAAAPLRLPIMRLVQQTMLPESRQVHLAEVFLSGLLERQLSSEKTSDPDAIHYDFLPGVRELLLDAGFVPDAIQIQRVVSRYIAGRFGQSIDFDALLADPDTMESITIDAQNQPFAIVTVEVLRRLGGRYAAAAQRLQSRAPVFPRYEWGSVKRLATFVHRLGIFIFCD